VACEENLLDRQHDERVVITLPEEIDVAVAAGADMRLVIRHPAARRVFEINGIVTVIGIYPDLPAALSGTGLRLVLLAHVRQSGGDPEAILLAASPDQECPVRRRTALLTGRPPRRAARPRRAAGRS
jgi:hypothetical protein